MTRPGSIHREPYCYTTTNGVNEMSEVKCQQCQSQMEKKRRVEKDLLMQFFGVLLFLGGISAIGISLFQYQSLFPFALVLGALGMWVGSKLGHDVFPIWLCPNCGYFFKR